MVGTGGVLGLAAALGLAHVLRALLYQTSIYDTLAFVAAPAVLCLVAGAAVLLPGKSTTIKIITGMLRPNDGRVLFEGQDTLRGE
jgi:ABC-type uncharacterized transport system ATPase subunit